MIDMIYFLYVNIFIKKQTTILFSDFAERFDVIMDNKPIVKALSLSIFFLIALAVAVVMSQYKAGNYLFNGKKVEATVISVVENDDGDEVLATYMKDGQTLAANVTCKQDLKVGEMIKARVLSESPDELYVLQNQKFTVAFLTTFMVFEVLGWLFVLHLLKKLRNNNLLMKNGKYADAEVIETGNTEGVGYELLRFTTENGDVKEFKDYPDGEPGEIGDKRRVLYYQKKSSKMMTYVQ